MTNNTVPLGHGVADAERQTEPSASTLSIEHHLDQVPAKMEEALYARYGSVYSSLPHFRVYGGLDKASTFVLRKGPHVAAIFLYRIDGKKAHVLNEGMDVDAEATTRFARFIFDHYVDVEFIALNGVEHSIKRLDFPFSQCFCTDDSVIDLPESAELYLQSLGKATRKNIKQYLNRLKRDYPGFEFRVHDGKTVDEQTIRHIVSLNRVRFDRKGKISGITAQEEDRIVQMLRACGLVGAITVDGSLCGGSLVYRIGDHYHSWLKAHDPAYDDYRLGLIGSFLMISECIRRGGKTYHLMWGREPHKALLNSQLRTFANMTVYRNHAAALRNCGVLFRQLYQHGTRQGKLWLLEVEKGSGTMSYPLRAGLSGVRKMKSLLLRQH